MRVDQIVFILLIVFALFSIFATNLKRAIICSSIFGLWVALTYLLYHAPDVAIAEAVIASSLGLILYIITIERYDDISSPNLSGRLLKRKAPYLLLIVSCGLAIYLTGRMRTVTAGPLFEYVMEVFFANDSLVNPVGSIYLNYRIFDTIFEALMLLISGFGVIHLSRHTSRRPR